MLQAPEPFQPFRGAVCRDLDGRVVVRRDEVAKISQPFSHNVEDGPAGRRRRVLRQARNPHPGLPPDRAAVGFQVTGDDLKKSRFTGPISSDERDSFVGLDLQRHAVQQW